MEFEVVLQQYKHEDDSIRLGEPYTRIENEVLAKCSSLDKALKVKQLFMDYEKYGGKIKDAIYLSLFIREAK